MGGVGDYQKYYSLGDKSNIVPIVTLYGVTVQHTQITATIMSNIDPQHIQDFRDSAISDDIADLNFRSFDGNDENELDEVFTLLIPEPDHSNNGTLSGTPQQELAAILRSGGWSFEGHKGKCVKPNSPRKVKDEKGNVVKDAEGKEKVIKYESPRGFGSLQLLIPRVSWAIGRKIAAKAGSVVEAKYLARMDANANPCELDCGFWDWILDTDLPIIITEGAKKACSLVSAGYPTIALNGIWGYGTNIKDMFENVERDEKGKSLKTIHPDLDPFLDGREIILAFDRDINPNTVRIVEAAKAAFLRTIGDDEIKVTQLKWRTPKGIDDYIAAKREKGLDRIYTNRKEITPPAPDKQTKGKKLDDDAKESYERLAAMLGIQLEYTDEGDIASRLNKLKMDLFEMFGEHLKLNLMTRDYELDGGQVDINNAKSFIADRTGWDYSTENCILAIHSISNRHAYHPVEQYLASLKGRVAPDFDVFNNIATLFLGNPDPLANKMMAKSFVGAVARVNKPGTKVDTLTVLQGGQGFLKSTFLKVLGGETWFCDDIRDLENKDELAKLARYWIIELAEVDYLMGRKEVESFKRFLSTTADTYRPPYGRTNIRHDRTCALFATTNKNEFLKDPTGSRRYWVVKVECKIDCDLVAKLRDVIWATALTAYDRGDTWWLTDDDETVREEKSEEFREPDAWEEIIKSKWDSLPIGEYNGDDRVEIDRVFELLDLDNDKRNKPNRNRIASILKLWGFKNKTINSEAGKVKAWLRPKAGRVVQLETSPQAKNLIYKVLDKYDFLGSSSNVTKSESAVNLELNLELNTSCSEDNELPQTSSQQEKEVELNLEPKKDVLELNDKSEYSVVELVLSSTLGSSLNPPSEPNLAKNEAVSIKLEPELSSSRNSSLESVSLPMEPKNLRKGDFETLKKSKSEKITHFKVGDRVNVKGERVGAVRNERDRKTPNSSYKEYEIDFGFDSVWFEAFHLELVEVA